MKSSVGGFDQVDLTNCDREPIHIPGAVQPHGCLFAFSTNDKRLIGFSSNAEKWLGRLPDLGESLSELFPQEFASLIAGLFDGPAGIVRHLRIPASSNSSDAAPSDQLAAVHMYDGRLIVELESDNARRADVNLLGSLPLRLTLINQRLQTSKTINELCQTIAAEVRGMSGYDRVMVYQFLEGGHGAVVGEEVDERFESFLGLHYPATDIPQPARRLYVLNTVRSIGDIEAEPAGIIQAASSEPVDLSYSCFRAVSPIHIEYLKNMGVRASMSISIIDNGQLWGLIACHHYEPKSLSFEERAACEIVGVTAGNYLTAREARSRSEGLAERRAVHARVMGEIAAEDQFNKSLSERGETLCKLVGADGVAICWRRELTIWGETPEKSVVTDLIERHILDTSKLSASPSLVSEMGFDRERLGSSRGVLAVPLSAPDLNGLLFFRNEYVREVHWAGDPNKAAEKSDDGIRLSPRLSFEQWSETVKDHCRDWSDIDLEMCEDIRSGMVELLGRRAAQLAKINSELRRLNDDLDSFAYAASHDLREPLRGLNHNLFLLEQMLSDQITSLPGCRDRFAAIDQLTSRMDDLVQGLLRLSRAGRGDLLIESLDLSTIVDDAVVMVWASGVPENARLTVDDQTGPIMADYGCLRELLTNLISNSAKYNDGHMAEITVRSHRDTDRRTVDGEPATVIDVQDNGIGIAPDQIGRIFQIFRRAPAAETYGSGTGAGLAIVRKIVQRHGGTIWVNSRPGSGSTFSFTLDVSD